MNKNTVSRIMSILLFGVVTLCLGCETEQSASKNNNGMVGYAQDHAKAQAELINQEQLKKTSLTQTVITDGSVQPLSSIK